MVTFVTFIDKSDIVLISFNSETWQISKVKTKK